MCGMSSVWLQGEGRGSASEEVPPPWVFSCRALGRAADPCCCAALPAPGPAGSSTWQVAPEEKRVFSDVQQLGITKALHLRVCLSGRLVAEKVLQSFCFNGRLVWWIKSCSRQREQIAVCPSVLSCMLVAWVTWMCDTCAYKYMYLCACVYAKKKKKKKINIYFYQKPCGQKKPFVLRRRYTKCWGRWEQVTSCPGQV